MSNALPAQSRPTVAKFSLRSDITNHIMRNGHTENRLRNPLGFKEKMSALEPRDTSPFHSVVSERDSRTASTFLCVLTASGKCTIRERCPQQFSFRYPE